MDVGIADVGLEDAAGVVAHLGELGETADRLSGLRKAVRDDAAVPGTILTRYGKIGEREFKTLGPLAGGGPINADGFIQMLDARGLTVNEACKDQMATESRNFTIQASGTVGEVTRTITTVMRVYNAVEELYYYSVR